MHPLYQDACSVLSKADRKQGTLKRLCLAPNIRNKRACLALASETFRYSEIIGECLKVANIADREGDFGEWMVRVLFYEVLVGKGKVQGGGAVSRFVKEHTPQVKEAFAKLMKAKGEELVKSKERDFLMPRYARVNTLKISVPAAIASLEQSGFQFVDYATVLEPGHTHTRKIFAKDFTLSDVLVFKHGIDLHDHPMVVSSELRLQDKASCFPAHVLAAASRPIRFALDACSAPGNKTTHLAALMGGEGKLFAIEMDKNRMQLLARTVEIMGATNVVVKSADFLTLPRNKKPYCDVEGIMLDPSCSGSGIVGRSARDGDADPKQQKERLQRLCEFQMKALDHALGFPRVRAVVYSTCSVHREENEDVVAACLEKHKDKFELGEALPSWPRRGLEGSFAGAEKCVRVKHEDYAQGFFVACFVRKGAHEESHEESHEETRSKAREGTAQAPSSKPPPQKRNELAMKDRSAREATRVMAGMKLVGRAYRYGGGSRGLSMAIIASGLRLGSLKRMAMREDRLRRRRRRWPRSGPGMGEEL